MIDLPLKERARWRWRWVVTAEHPSAMHRVAAFERIDDEWVQMHGVVTVCGRSATVVGMLGMLNRLGAPRCKVCCRRIGIPPGDGMPFNVGIEEPGCEGPERRDGEEEAAAASWAMAQSQRFDDM